MSGINSGKGQTLVFLNVRSVMANISQLQAEFWLANHVALGFCETWLSKYTLEGNGRGNDLCHRRFNWRNI